MPSMPWVHESRLQVPQLTRDSIAIGSDAWREWLGARDTTSFRFEGDGASFTARREVRSGHSYWYAYRRRGRRVEKAYLGRSEAIDLNRLRDAALRLSAPAPDTPQTPLPRGIEANYVSPLPAPATRLIGRERFTRVLARSRVESRRFLAPARRGLAPPR